MPGTTPSDLSATRDQVFAHRVLLRQMASEEGLTKLRSCTDPRHRPDRLGPTSLIAGLAPRAAGSAQAKAAMAAVSSLTAVTKRRKRSIKEASVHSRAAISWVAA